LAGADNKPLHPEAELKKIKKSWVELWFKMANGSIDEYNRIIALDVLDFWGIYDLWLQRIKDENARNRSRNNKS
jgi:hypothetical protein